MSVRPSFQINNESGSQVKLSIKLLHDKASGLASATEQRPEYIAGTTYHRVQFQKPLAGVVRFRPKM